jgi:hypothetical protein
LRELTDRLRVTSKYTWRQEPAVIVPTLVVAPSVGPANEFCVVFHAQVATRFVAGSEPVLHTRTPTGKTFGPTFTLFESRPTTSQVIGVTVRGPAAAFGDAAEIPNAIATRATTTKAARACRAGS